MGFETAINRPINRVILARSASAPLCGAATMLSVLPDELLQLLFAKLDAIAACRLSQVDKAFQQWSLLHHEECVQAWRHACAWLMLCKRAKARMLYRRAGFRGVASPTLNHFTPVPGAAAPPRRGPHAGIAQGIVVRCCSCTNGTQLYVSNPTPLWNHLKSAHPALYAQLRS